MRKQKKYHFIYKTTNIITKKYYIGMHSSDNLVDGYVGSGRRLKYSINKYGKENHIREIIEFCKTREELKLREKEIVNLNEIANQECMNLKVGGGGIDTHSKTTREEIIESRKWYKHSDETKMRMSEAKKKYFESNDSYFKGKLQSKTTIEKKRLSLTEYYKYHSHYISDETKIRMSIAKQNMSDITKQKMSIARQGAKNPAAKKCIDIETGIVYGCIKEMSDSLKIPYKKLYYKLTQSTKNDNYKFL
jgi:hypothetical protein